MESELTIVSIILDYLGIKPRSSAYEVSRDLNLNYGSISSLMKQMVDRGLLIREKGLGPKRGYGYSVVRN